MSDATTPMVGVIMGSDSDWETMRHAVEVLERFEVPHEKRVVSAHRKDAPAIAFERESDIGSRHGEAADNIAARSELGTL